jgi:hypothetical protein
MRETKRWSLGGKHTIEIMKTLGAMTSQSSRRTMISLTTTISPSTDLSWRCSRIGEAVATAPMKALARMENLILTDAAARGWRWWEGLTIGWLLTMEEEKKNRKRRRGEKVQIKRQLHEMEWILREQSST